MKLYTIPNCAECEEIIKFLSENKDFPVDVVTLQKWDGVWSEEVKTIDRVEQVPVNYSSFPVLYFGKDKDKDYGLVGKEGIKDYIIKGFIHDINSCPFLGKDCIERKCELFTILYNGMVPEGSCSLKWLPTLAVETMTLLKK